jgi:hypothetical protein
MAVSWALCNNPTHFDPVPMHLKLRIAKTREHVTEEGMTIPALRIHFVIEEVVGGYHVVLKSIEAM